MYISNTFPFQNIPNTQHGCMWPVAYDACIIAPITQITVNGDVSIAGSITVTVGQGAEPGKNAFGVSETLSGTIVVNYDPNNDGPSSSENVSALLVI